MEMDNIRLKSSQRISMSGIQLEELIIASWDNNVDEVITILNDIEVEFDK